MLVGAKCFLFSRIFFFFFLPSYIVTRVYTARDKTAVVYRVAALKIQLNRELCVSSPEHHRVLLTHNRCMRLLRLLPSRPRGRASLACGYMRYLPPAIIRAKHARAKNNTTD